jgi:hypothetical protein
MHATRIMRIGETTVPFLIIFTLGYLLGGISALFILGLTVAARQGDRGHATPPAVEERV